MDRVAIFVDVQNVYYTVKQGHGCHFNYQAFWEQATHGRKLESATAYAIDRGDPKQIQFQAILQSIGFEVKLRPYIQRRDGTAKGDWDVGITIDMLESGPHIDRAVLVSGDGDFDLVVKKLREAHGVVVDVFGVESLTSNALIDASSHFFPIEGQLLLT